MLRKTLTLLNKHASHHTKERPELLDTIYTLAKKSQTTPVTLAVLKNWNLKGDEMLLFGATWLQQELKIRLAKQIYDMDRMPSGLNLMPSMRKVRYWYVLSFEEIVASHKIQSETGYFEFAKLVEKIYERHAPTMITVARGIFEFRDEMAKTLGVSDLQLANLSNYSDLHKVMCNIGGDM